MSKVTMPEPVAYRFAAPIAGEGGGIVGRRDWQYSATQKGFPWWDRNGLVTQEKAEAYAADKVREALEEAALVCDAYWKELDVARRNGKPNQYIEGALDCADILEQRIKALIPGPTGDINVATD